VATHHDGMSGTERQDVTDDYEQRISESHFEVEAGVGVALQKLLDLPPTEKLLHCNCNECESGVVLSHLWMNAITFAKTGSGQTQGKHSKTTLKNVFSGRGTASTWRSARQQPVRAGHFVCDFPYVCPEPVLAKVIVLV
jgi:hypothetical protein